MNEYLVSGQGHFMGEPITACIEIARNPQVAVNRARIKYEMVVVSVSERVKGEWNVLHGNKIWRQ